MPNLRRNKPRKAGEVNDANEANTDRTSLDGEDEEDANANASGQVDEEANILAAIRLLRADVSTQMREVITSNQEIVFTERLTSAEIRISKAEDDISSLASKESSLQKKGLELTLKLDDLENSHRRSNLRLISLPERTEGGDTVSFVQTWLPEVLGTDALTSPIIIERAHRLPVDRLQKNPPPPRHHHEVSQLSGQGDSDEDGVPERESDVPRPTHYVLPGLVHNGTKTTETI